MPNLLLKVDFVNQPDISTVQFRLRQPGANGATLVGWTNEGVWALLEPGGFAVDASGLVPADFTRGVIEWQDTSIGGEVRTEMINASPTLADVQLAGLAGAGNAQVSSPLPSQCSTGFLLTLKRGDTLPSVALHLLDGDGSPVSLPTGTTVQFHMGQSGRVKINEPASIADAATALVQYAWAAGDTDTAGIYAAEFQVTFPGGSVETWPNQGNLTIRILSDIA